MPDPYEDLSVTRRLNLSERRVWEIGEGVASGQQRTLHACADVLTEEVQAQDLEAVAAPTPCNEHHANVIGWPRDKHLRKQKAERLAAKSIVRLEP